MKKLYNIFEELILEQSGTPATIEDVQNAMDNHYTVNFEYDDGTGTAAKGKRYCKIFAIGTTDANNTGVRIYQVSGDSKRGGHWKTVLLNRMYNFKATKFRFYAPPDELHNALGDKTLNIPNGSSNANIAIFGGKYMDRYREKHNEWQSDIRTQKTNEPLSKDRYDNPYDDFEGNEVPLPSPETPKYKHKDQVAEPTKQVEPPKPVEPKLKAVEPKQDVQPDKEFSDDKYGHNNQNAGQIEEPVDDEEYEINDIENER